MTEEFLGVNIFAPEYMGGWHDLTMMIYNWGNACLFCCVASCLVQLIVLNQIDEEHAISYIEAMGPMAKKFSFRALLGGLVLPLAGPMFLRINATMQTMGGFALHIGTGPILAYVSFTLFRSVKALYVCLDEQEAYDPIALKKDVIMAMCTKYFDEHPDDYSTNDFCNSLTFVSPKKYKIPLSYGTKLRAMQCFYTVLSEREDLDLDKKTIGQQAIHMADTMPIDHEGQEMSLGDDTEDISAALHMSPNDKTTGESAKSREGTVTTV
jgi:hypothetical protein